MALHDPSVLAAFAFVIVGVVAAVLASLTYRAYQATSNVRLLFILIAFLVFVLKSLFMVVNEMGDHMVGHDSALLVSALFDVIVVLLLFAPFMTPKSR